MFLNRFNLGFKSLRLASIFIALIGLAFVFASGFIGILSIRLVAIALIVFCVINLDFSFLFNKDKILNIIGIVGGILIFIYPQFIMFLIGTGLLVYSVPMIFNSIRKKDFSDILSLIIACLALFFGIYSVLNGTTAISTIVKFIGIIFVIAGCIFFYRSIDLEKSTSNFVNDINIGVNEFRYRHAEETEEEN